MSSENILELENIEVVYDDVILALYDVTLNVLRERSLLY